MATAHPTACIRRCFERREFSRVRMPIKFHVRPGTVVLCDYQGFHPPEMVKRRPAIVVSPRLAHRDALCTVVPLGRSPPRVAVDYQCQVQFEPALPEPFAYSEFWAKADMLATVSLQRLDLFRTPRDQYGKRKYQPKLTAKDFSNVQQCITKALGFDTLTLTTKGLI